MPAPCWRLRAPVPVLPLPELTAAYLRATASEARFLAEHAEQGLSAEQGHSLEYLLLLGGLKPAVLICLSYGTSQLTGLPQNERLMPEALRTNMDAYLGATDAIKLDPSAEVRRWRAFSNFFSSGAMTAMVPSGMTKPFLASVPDSTARSCHAGIPVGARRGAEANSSADASQC